MNDWSVTSTRFPYLTIQIEISGQVATVEALIDTGYDGDVVLPPGAIERRTPAQGSVILTLADGSEVSARLLGRR
jgi:predicted aspartyl protease